MVYRQEFRLTKGRENVLIARHMIKYKGVNRKLVLVGSSVHNQRIERLWRDSHRCAISLYYQLFFFLEENELLNPLDKEHMYALQYVFVRKVNKSLEVFRGAWNNHGIQTANEKSPLLMFTSGILTLRHSGLTAFDFLTQLVSIMSLKIMIV